MYQTYFLKTGWALFFSGLRRLGIGPAFLVLFFPVISALFEPFDSVIIKHRNPGPAGIEAESSSGAERGQEATTSKEKYASDKIANWVTTRENELADLINNLRKEEHMRPLAPYRIQHVIESLEDTYSIECLDDIVKDVKEK